MNNHKSIGYLVNSKLGIIWVKVGDAPWTIESDVSEEPKKYFSTLKGIFYMRQFPKSATKLFNSYKEFYGTPEDSEEVDNYNEGFERN